MELKQTIKRLVKEKQIETLLKRGTLISKEPQVQKSGETLYLLTYVKYSMAKYEVIVNQLVKEKYSDSEEFAILRKAIGNPNNDEYLIYNAYVEDCKVRAREFVNERESVLGDNK